mmetsp:Transcript_15284/g.41340  ORF Transcript_15284/g.41340 Transcript_15284/m.41340 type:complete len:188 (-) Transcript_15284:110-673(-)
MPCMPVTKPQPQLAMPLACLSCSANFNSSLRAVSQRCYSRYTPSSNTTSSTVSITISSTTFTTSTIPCCSKLTSTRATTPTPTSISNISIQVCCSWNDMVPNLNNLMQSQGQQPHGGAQVPSISHDYDLMQCHEVQCSTRCNARHGQQGGGGAQVYTSLHHRKWPNNALAALGCSTTSSAVLLLYGP